jgi:outer membrane protein assembly factor BamD
MYRKTFSIALLSAAVFTAGCHHNKVQNPIANVDSKQPDKVLFDRSMDAMKHAKYDVARITLQTLINTYPDSEYIARAKLAVGDSWLAEGGSTGYQQAEVEYKDFQTFFPNMPEAAEAQMKVADIHYRQMEKPDRDFTHMKRAEDEYRQMIQQYPDSKLVPQAKQRLREVQEVLAEREYRIGRFYYLRESWPAAIARLKSLVDAYPLYSGADEALYLLGQSYEGQIATVRENGKLPETIKARLIENATKNAGNAYAKLIQRYPVMERAGDAKSRLESLHLPVPTPTGEAIAENKAEQDSRSELSRLQRFKLNFYKRPDVAQTAKVGEPSLQDPKPTNAPDVVRDVVRMATGPDTSTATVETVKEAPTTKEAPPRSEDNSAETTTVPSTKPADANAPQQGPDGSGNASAPLPPPSQVNDVSAGQADTAKDSSTSKSEPDKKKESTSKKKKKSGLRKIIPF